jgi:polyhydroxyalkanoate synthesis regulator phasin
MASNERIRKYLDAGSVLGQVSRGRAEEIVRELVNAGDIQRGQAQEWVDSLTERSRRSSEQILDLVRSEVAAQLSKIDSTSLENLANQVAEVLKKSAEAGRKTTRDVTNQAGKQAGKVTKQASQQASKVTTQATKVTKQATSRATKTAQDVAGQAGKTATRARAAAQSVTPRRGAKPSGPPSTDKPHKAAS